MDKTISYLTNPMNIQLDVLEEFESRLDGKSSLVDANNSFMFMLEANSRIVSEAMNTIDDKLNSLYPKRAQSTEDLYNHVSDYEYIGFFAYPSSTRLSMIMNKDYIMNNAVQYGTSNYKVVVIPRDTVFVLGEYKFSLYYPIMIRVNNIIGNITVVQDTTKSNPLHSLTSNSIVKKEFDYNGIDIVAIEFDVFQFYNDIVVEQVRSSYGYKKRYSYNDKFYAIRAFTKNQSGIEYELKISLSESVYDPYVPTAVIKIYPDVQELTFRIPQIYFDNAKIGSEVRVEIMTTKGDIDVYLANIDKDTIKTSFALKSPNTDIQYSKMLTNLTTMYVNPLEKRITGGSNNLSFEQIKDIVIYHKNYDKIPITNAELEVYFNHQGFEVHRKRDNITDRVFYAFRKLKYGKDGILVGVLNIPFTVYPENYPSGFSTIKKTSDQFTILPTTLFKYETLSSSVRVMTDTEIASLHSDSNNIDELNTSNYMFSPHHVVINYKLDFPSVWVYDLMNTSVSSISFEQENIYMSAQTNILTSDIKHLGNNLFNLPGDAGYKIRIGISKSDEFKDIPEADFVLYMTFRTVHGVKIGKRGTYVSTVNDMYVYDFDIMCDYAFTEDGISVSNMANAQGIVASLFIPLKGKLYLSSHVKSTYATGVANDQFISSFFIENDGSYTSIALQSIDYVLGEKISDVVDSNLISNWSAEEFERYEADVLDVYEHDVYETNGPPVLPDDPPEGTLKYTIVNGEVVLNKLHSIGEVKLDGSGDPIVKYRVGDIKTTVCGEPTVSTSRTLALTLDMLLTDFKYGFYDNEFSFDIAATMQAYLRTMRTIQDNILENTTSYFRPVTTMSTAVYKINNSTKMTMALDLSFSLKCYTSQAVHRDITLRKMIADEIVEVIELHLDKQVVSFTDICAEIRDNLGDFIVSLDVVSINGMSDLQTIAMTEDDKKPILKKVLQRNLDGSIELVPDVTIEFEQFDV